PISMAVTDESWVPARAARGMAPEGRRKRAGMSPPSARWGLGPRVFTRSLQRDLVARADLQGGDAAAHVAPDLDRRDDVAEVVEVDLAGRAGVVDRGADLQQAEGLFEVAHAHDLAVGVGDLTQAVADVGGVDLHAVDVRLGGGQADHGHGVV